MDTRNVGTRIRKLRRERDLTQAQLGGDRLSESYVSLIESGRRIPPAEVLSYLARRLGSTVEVLRGDEEMPDAGQAELLIRMGEWEAGAGQPGRALEHLDAGTTLATSLGLAVLASRGQVARARALEADGQIMEALQAWRDLLNRGANDPRNIPWAAAIVGLSRCYREAGDLEKAVEVAEGFWNSPTEIADGPEDRILVGVILLGAHLELGNQRRCHELAGELAALADATDTPMAAGSAYWNAALAAETEGRVADALRLSEKAQSKLSQIEDVRNRARLQTALAGLHLRADPPEVQEAFRLLHAAEPVLNQFANPIDINYCQTELARAHLHVEDFDQAVSIASGAISDLDGSDDARLEKARTLMVRALAESATGAADAASADAANAVVLLEEFGSGRRAASTWTELAELYVELGDSERAIDAFRRATLLLGANKAAGSGEAGEGEAARAADAG